MAADMEIVITSPDAPADRVFALACEAAGCDSRNPIRRVDGGLGMLLSRPVSVHYPVDGGLYPPDAGESPEGYVHVVFTVGGTDRQRRTIHDSVASEFTRMLDVRQWGWRIWREDSKWMSPTEWRNQRRTDYWP